MSKSRSLTQLPAVIKTPGNGGKVFKPDSDVMRLLLATVRCMVGRRSINRCRRTVGLSGANVSSLIRNRNGVGELHARLSF
jgi:hypothetical protein